MTGNEESGGGTRQRHGGWLRWLLGAAALAAVVLLAVQVSEERAFVTLLERARPGWLAVAAILQAATYLAQAQVWRVVLRRAGRSVALASACRLSLAKLFVDQALPSMGVSGTLVVTQALCAAGHDRPAVFAAVAVDTAGYFLAYVACLATALALALQSGHATPLIVGIAILLCLFGAATAVAVLVAAGRDPGARLRRLLAVPGIGRALDLLQQADAGLARSPALLALAVLLQASIFALDAATLGCLLRSLGGELTPASVFVSFMISSLLRTFGFMPGGLGTFEAASVSTLALAGAPVPLALSATLLFRGLSFWLPMVPGLAVSRRLAR